VIRRARRAWGPIYHSSNTRPAWAMLRTTFGGRVRDLIARTLRRVEPDLVISVHPLLNHVAIDAIGRSARRRPPLATVVTDLINLHRGWASARTDLVVVPTDAARESMLRRGVPAARLRTIGLPVARQFRPASSEEKQQLRLGLGLDPLRPTLLMSSGAEGSSGLLDQVLSLCGDRNAWQVIVVCGRNAQVRRRLHRCRLRTPTRIFGYVDTMPDLMRASDLVVGKAGPGAIAEALATGLPILLTSYLPGQEAPNVRYVVQQEVGLYVKRPELLRGTVLQLLERDGAELARMTRRAELAGRRGATDEIVDECLRLVGGRASLYWPLGQARR
jgi:1,2-diacylglycerol 3-beta-galactosyltransferase